MDVSEDFPAVVVRRGETSTTTGVERLHIGDLPPGEILIEIQWSGLNFKDAMVTTHGNRVSRMSPLVAGVDLAGVVVSSSDPNFAPGATVLAHGHDLGVAHHGGFAAYARVPASWVVPLEGGLSAREAMIVGTAGFTAALSLDELERHGLGAPDGPVLVTGASGGVGSFAVALLSARGYQVVASSGKDSEHGWLETLGATQVIGRDDLDDATTRALGPERFAAAVDCVGGSTLGRILRTLRYGAAVAASGLTGGPELSTTVYPFITRQVALLGVDSVRTGPLRRREIWDRLSGELELPDLDLFVDREVPLDGVVGALEDLRASKVRGRVLVRIAP